VKTGLRNQLIIESGRGRLEQEGRFEDLMEKMKKEQEDIEPLNLGAVSSISSID
jgi:hypothetical protein